MFESFRQGFRVARHATGVVRENPRLAVFPLLSSAAGLLLIASFLLPLWSTGTLQQLEEVGLADQDKPLFWIQLFAFYFCSNLIMVFFNTALVAAAVDAITGREVTIRGGLRAAAARLPQLLAWAALSALVGVALRALERANQRVGALVSALLGTGWTALTYFVVPALAVEGCGPVQAVRRSGQILREKWSRAFVGDLAVDWLGFLFALPFLALAFLLYLVLSDLGYWALPPALLVGGTALLASFALSGAADMIVRLILYEQALEREVPEHLRFEAPEP